MSSPCILVVDDNPTNLRLAADVLECEGYEILKAIDAEEAQQIIAQGRPELVLLDIALPGMDGLTLTRKLRSEEKTRHLIIVALTAFAMKGDEQKARDAGCDGYITKPIDTRALPGQVAAYLRATQPQPVKAALKILVIEDSTSDLKLAQHVLISAGHEVSGAEAVEEALQAVKRDKPQIILLDLLLPGTDGLVLARKLKSDPATRDILIVAVTSSPEGFPRAEVLAAGCDAYLVKPINTRRLPELLEEVVNGSAVMLAPEGTPR
jgi:two-component system, cell cycle response regulator